MIKIIIINLLFLITYSFSLDVTSQALVNKTHNIGWYFWSTKEGTNTLYYLANGRKNKNIRVWNFTDQRKWRPIHNAPTFDGFTRANKNFDKISFSSDGRKITFGNKTINSSGAINYFLETLKNKTFDIVWYFWESNSYPFLASGRNSESGIKIWQYITGGKWRPIHNTGPYDGFAGADKVFDEVEIDDNGWTIKIVKNSYDIPTIQKDSSFPKGDNIYPTFAVYSKDFKSGEDYAGGFPHIRWASLPTHTKSIAIEIIDTSATNYKNILYRAINIAVDTDKTSISSADVVAPGLVLPNDVDSSVSFIQPTSKHTISINVYAVKIEKASSFLNAKENALSHRILLYKVP